MNLFAINNNFLSNLKFSSKFSLKFGNFCQNSLLFQKFNNKFENLLKIWLTNLRIYLRIWRFFSKFANFSLTFNLTIFLKLWEFFLKFKYLKKNLTIYLKLNNFSQKFDSSFERLTFCSNLTILYKFDNFSEEFGFFKLLS